MLEHYINLRRRIKSVERILVPLVSRDQDFANEKLVFLQAVM